MDSILGICYCPPVSWMRPKPFSGKKKKEQLQLKKKLKKPGVEADEAKQLEQEKAVHKKAEQKQAVHKKAEQNTQTSKPRIK